MDKHWRLVNSGVGSEDVSQGAYICTATTMFDSHGSI